MMATWICLMTILLPLAKAQIGVELPEVELPEGTLLGGLRASYSGRVFSSFQGVPYAAPPVGDLRYAVTLYKIASLYLLCSFPLMICSFYSPLKILFLGNPIL